MDFQHDLEDGYFATKYGKMHYKHHQGKGTPIVFLHGFSASIKSWTRLVHFLPGTMDIYLLDLMGHGESEAPEMDYSLRMHYESVFEFARSNIDSEPILFGHSYGGWIAAYYAAHEKVGGLVLEDSAGLRSFAEERHRNNPGYRELMIKDALALNPREHVLRSMLYSDNEASLLDKELLGHIKCRCLVIWGSNDRIALANYAGQFHDMIKGSTLKMVEDARHTPHYSHPEVVAGMLLKFL